MGDVKKIKRPLALFLIIMVFAWINFVAFVSLLITLSDKGIWLFISIVPGIITLISVVLAKKILLYMENKSK